MAFPRLLLVTHWYCPPSALLTFVIVKVLLSSPQKILGSSFVFIREPLLVHDIIVAGFPLALQDNVTFSPSIFVAFCGRVVISGATVIRKEDDYLIQDYWGPTYEDSTSSDFSEAHT